MIDGVLICRPLKEALTFLIERAIVIERQNQGQIDQRQKHSHDCCQTHQSRPFLWIYIKEHPIKSALEF